MKIFNKPFSIHQQIQKQPAFKEQGDFQPMILQPLAPDQSYKGQTEILMQQPVEVVKGLEPEALVHHELNHAAVCAMTAGIGGVVLERKNDPDANEQTYKGFVRPKYRYTQFPEDTKLGRPLKSDGLSTRVLAEHLSSAMNLVAPNIKNPYLVSQQKVSDGDMEAYKIALNTSTVILSDGEENPDLLDNAQYLATAICNSATNIYYSIPQEAHQEAVRCMMDSPVCPAPDLGPGSTRKVMSGELAERANRAYRGYLPQAGLKAYPGLKDRFHLADSEIKALEQQLNKEGEY